MRTKDLRYFLPFVLFVVGYFFAYSLFHTKGVVTPNVVGKPLCDAIKILSNAGLNTRFFRAKENIDVAPGVVLEQAPKSGIFVKPNSHIFVTIAKHDRGIQTPHLLGKKYTLLGEQVKGRRIRPEIFWLRHAYPKNFCVAQSPTPGKILGNNELIAYCSRGRDTLIVVPDFRGHGVNDVRASLEKEGVSVEVFCKHGCQSCTKCQVVGQNPVPGKIIDKSRRLYVQLQSG